MIVALMTGTFFIVIGLASLRWWHGQGAAGAGSGALALGAGQGGGVRDQARAPEGRADRAGHGHGPLRAARLVAGTNSRSRACAAPA